YQFTLFRVGLRRERPDLASGWAAGNLVMGHVAVTDLAERRHVFSEVLYRETALLGGFGRYPDPRLGWSRAPAGTGGGAAPRASGASFDVAVADRARGLAYSLATRPLKPLVFEGPNGYSRKGGDTATASQYYSFTRLATEGTLALGGRTVAVRGESWMGKEVGSDQLAEMQVGWGWRGRRVADGR